MILISKNPSTLCYGHLGVRDNAVDMLKTHKEQLLLWNDIIGTEMVNFDKEDFVDRCIDRLLHEDGLLSGFSQMEKAVKERELGFLANSVKGFAGHLKRIQ